jgi:dTDP-4-amino-4,6-dideoxygalactose transaminase
MYGMAALRFVDLEADYAALEEAINRATRRVLASGNFILGEEVERFEASFAAYCGCRHAVGVNSGLDALTLLLRSQGIGPGQEVITAVNTFAATVYSIQHTGARPVLVDCAADTLNLDLDQVEAAITPRTRAIVAVHLYGRLLDMARLRDLAQRRHLVLVEDAAQAHGVVQAGLRPGALSVAAAYSFYPSKNLGAYGDAGAVVTNVDEIATYVRQARTYGQARKNYHLTPLALNSRMDALQAALLSTKLPYLDQRNQARRQAAAFYQQTLSDLPLQLPPPADPPGEHVWHLFPLQVSDRHLVQERLRQRGVPTGIHYPCPVHLQPAFAALGLGPGDYPVAEAAAERLLSLPMHPFLTESQLHYVSDQLHSVLRGVRVA